MMPLNEEVHEGVCMVVQWRMTNAANSRIEVIGGRSDSSRNDRILVRGSMVGSSVLQDEGSEVMMVSDVTVSDPLYSFHDRASYHLQGPRDTLGRPLEPRRHHHAREDH